MTYIWLNAISSTEYIVFHDGNSESRLVIRTLMWSTVDSGSYSSEHSVTCSNSQSTMDT